MNPLRSTYNWTLSLAHKKRASSWLAALSFSEASFFPIPPDVLLIPLCLGNIRKALKFAPDLLNRFSSWWPSRLLDWGFCLGYASGIIF